MKNVATSAVLVLVIVGGTFARPPATANGHAATGHGSHRQPTFQGVPRPPVPNKPIHSKWDKRRLRHEVELFEPAWIYYYPPAPGIVDPAQNEQMLLEMAEYKIRRRQILKEAREAEMENKMAVARQRNGDRKHGPAQIAPSVIVAGEIDFPAILQDEKFEGYRAQVARLVEQMSITGRLSPEERVQIDKIHRQLLCELKENVQDTPPNDYTAALKFVRELSAELKDADSHLPHRLDDVSHLAADGQ
jgi:hypothetical protein